MAQCEEQLSQLIIYKMLCLLVVLFFFLRRVALVIGVLLSSKSCFVWWGACLFSLKSCSACCVICFLASSKVCFTCGVCLACGVAWFVERWSFVSCFSVSINKLKIYEQHFMIQFYKLWLLGFLVWSSSPDLGLLWSYSSERLSV